MTTPLALRKAVDNPGDLNLGQYAHWYSTVLEFKPDLILEFGRGKGNSTALFTQAANVLKNLKVASFCMTDDWNKESAPRIKEFVEPDWFNPLDIHVCNFLTHKTSNDIEKLISDSNRVLVLWDAHGFDVAEFILGNIMPQIELKSHLVIMHDISDIRYTDGGRKYNEQGLWKGGNDFADGRMSYLVLGNATSPFSQLTSITDFCSRNGVSLESSDHVIATQLSSERKNDILDAWVEFWEFPVHWHFFSTNGSPNIFFPPWKAPSDRTISELSLDDQLSYLTNELQLIQNSRFWKMRCSLMGLIGKKQST